MIDVDARRSVAGIIMSLSQMVAPGDYISIQGGPEGRVIETNWRCTTLEYISGDQRVVPNSVMVSTAVKKCNPYSSFIVPLALKTDTPNIKTLLLACEQIILDELIDSEFDWEQKRPRAYVTGSGLSTVLVEVKVYQNRKQDIATFEQAVMPALVRFLQQQDVLAIQT